MVCRKGFVTTVLIAITFFISAFIPHFAYSAATITVVNQDGPDEGFNDATPAAPVGGNPETTVGEQRLFAFQYAADIWGSLIDSSVEIRVGARFDPMFCDFFSAILGGAGPNTAHRDFTDAPLPVTWYTAALANKLAGVDLCELGSCPVPDEATDDIGATFNSNLNGNFLCLTGISWYYGIDGNSGGNIDFVTVVLHELAHGLGFLTFVDLATGQKLGGLDDSYMLNLEDDSIGLFYPDMTDAERVVASTDTGDLHWVGPEVVANSGFLTAGRDPMNGHVEMYAPSPQEPGSSVSHFSTSLFPEQVMEPSYTGPNHDVGLSLDLMIDIGWGSPSCVPITEICNDGIDNDCDGQVDCLDSECSADPACPVACTPTHNKEKGPRCSDSIDNDCDSLIDGADPDCQSGDSCTPTETTEVSCSDDIDNDCDGLTDSADPNCGGGSCTDKAKGESCTADAECCSLKCRGKEGAKTCK